MAALLDLIWTVILIGVLMEEGVDWQARLAEAGVVTALLTALAMAMGYGLAAAPLSMRPKELSNPESPGCGESSSRAPTACVSCPTVTASSPKAWACWSTSAISVSGSAPGVTPCWYGTG